MKSVQEKMFCYGCRYSCACALGYIGQRCQGDVYDCRSDPCQNGGTCLEMTGGVAGFTCKCSPLFSGRLCETAITVCTSSPCKNGGKCVPSGHGKCIRHVCVCLWMSKGDKIVAKHRDHRFRPHEWSTETFDQYNYFDAFE